MNPSPKHYRQEVIKAKKFLVDLVSRHSSSTSIPIPPGYTLNEIVQIRDILNDSGWEIVTVEADWIWFKRYVEGKYSGT